MSSHFRPARHPRPPSTSPAQAPRRKRGLCEDPKSLFSDKKTLHSFIFQAPRAAAGPGKGRWVRVLRTQLSKEPAGRRRRPSSCGTSTQLAPAPAGAPARAAHAASGPALFYCLLYLGRRFCLPTHQEHATPGPNSVERALASRSPPRPLGPAPRGPRCWVQATLFRFFLKITLGITGLIFSEKVFLCTWHLDVDSFLAGLDAARERGCSPLGLLRELGSDR